MENSTSQNDRLTAIRADLREYEKALPKEKRKALGQFFTEPRVARLLAALAVTGTEQRVVDPMVGHGSLLEAAAERLRIFHRSVDLFGVEVDAPTARLGRERMSVCVTEFGQRSSKIIGADAFSGATWGELGGHFHLVIANPPYVRYQLGGEGRDVVRERLLGIAESLVNPLELDTWRGIIRSYSGLSDLSVPSWFLCGMLCRPGGTLALVVPRTWMNRDYARLVQYFHLRFFQPLYVIEESGRGWFDDAQVPTTLVISRRLPTAESSVPLHRRRYRDQQVCRVVLKSEAANSVSLVGNVFAGDAELALKNWLDSGGEQRRGIDARRESLAQECRRLLVIGDRWLGEFEGEFASLAPHDNSSDALVPRPLANVIECVPSRNLQRLADLGVNVGQGLRTGCNPFFYVEVERKDAASSLVRVSELLGSGTMDVPNQLLRAVLRRQSEIRGFSIHEKDVAGRVLDLRGLEIEDNNAAMTRLFIPGTIMAMPAQVASYIRRGAKTVVGRNGKAVPLPELTAVAPNMRREADGVLTRHWYMLPDFAPRHTPFIAVPRVNDKTPIFTLIASHGLVVDANFSTVYDCGVFGDALALLAILNSTWCRACCEALGSPMGGGALKLEATHVRMLPVPKLDEDQIAALRKHGSVLAKTPQEGAAEVLRQIDRIVLRAICGGVDEGEADAMVERVKIAGETLRMQRSRNG